MVILGVDPGSTTVGYALIEDGLGTPRFIEAGLIPIRSREREEMLKELYRGLEKIIAKGNPSVLATERLFFSKNQKTALAVAEARGVILLTSALAGLTVIEYTPLEIKKVVAGDGNADKIRLKKMVLLALPELAAFRARDDVFDAIAAALTFCYLKKFQRFTH